MRVKHVILRARAVRDVEEALTFYLDEGTKQTALAFVDDLERAYTHIGRYPAIGSPRYDHELSIPGLRCWKIARFPHLVFYVERDDHVDVWRVLHGQRDIPASMREPT